MGSSIGASFQTTEWQPMQVLTGGMPATADSSAAVWQKRQSMPNPPTWCLWLNGTSCSTATSTLLIQGQRLTVVNAKAAVPASNAPATIEALERVLVLGEKIWAIGSGGVPSAAP